MLASTDPDGYCSDMSFSYALCTSDYGTNTLFYSADGSWAPWLVNGESTDDLAGTSHLQVVFFTGTQFSFDDGIYWIFITTTKKNLLNIESIDS